MFLKIEKDKVKYVAILNGESILIKVEDIKKSITTSEDEEDIYLMNIKTGMFVESEYLVNPDNAKRGHIVGVSNTFSIEQLESFEGYYNTVAVKLIKDKLIEDLGLVETDITILAETEWRHSEQTIRLTIPVEEVIESSFYRGLMDALIGANVIRYKVGDYYVLYLSWIDEAHRPVLEADNNILIEEK